jgi:uncharacterized protein
MNRTARSRHPTDVPSDLPADVQPEKIFLTAEWRQLAMLNYVAKPALLLPYVPRGTELDYWNEKTFLSLVGFQFLKTRMFGRFPVPLHSNFDEVNLRFYVRREVGCEVRRGVGFIREIVPRRAIALIARTFYNENYVALPMSHEIESRGEGHRVAYRWRSGKDWSGISLETDSHAEIPAAGSLEQFITEHYWGYAAQPGGGCVEYRVTHPPWKVWQVGRCAFEGDAEKLYGKDVAVMLRDEPHSALLAEGSPVAVMRGRKL